MTNSPSWSRNGLADDIQRRITKGEWRPGQKLPTTAFFAEEYGASEDLVYHAFVVLIARQVVLGVRGGRRYVAGADPEPTGDLTTEDTPE